MLVKRLAIRKIPSFLIETAFTVMGTAAYEKGDTDTRSIGDICFFDSGIIHGAAPLQMKDAGLDFLRFPDVPEVFAQIATGPAHNIHLTLVLIMTLGAFPFQVVIDLDFSVKSADLAVVGLCVKFGILDIVVNKANKVFHSCRILLHIRNLDIGDAASCRNGLELIFELEFAESIDMFTDINMIGIGIVSFVRNILDSAEAFLVDAGKPVAQGFSRGSIQRESQSRFSTPLLAGRVEVLHDTHSKFLAFRCRVAASLHGHRAFIKADIPQRQRGVAIFQELINGFALL